MALFPIIWECLPSYSGAAGVEKGQNFLSNQDCGYHESHIVSADFFVDNGFLNQIPSRISEKIGVTKLTITSVFEGILSIFTSVCTKINM
jgi:hypothetical protein